MVGGPLNLQKERKKEREREKERKKERRKKENLFAPIQFTS